MHRKGATFRWGAPASTREVEALLCATSDSIPQQRQLGWMSKAGLFNTTTGDGGVVIVLLLLTLSITSG